MDRSLRSTSADGAAGREGVLIHMRTALRRTLTRLRLMEEVGGTRAVGSGTVLPFPIRGEVLLVRLADLLRDRLDSPGMDADPFVLTVSRHPRPLLSIDRSAYVEFHAGSELFHLIIDVTSDARVTLETGNFDTLVRFVLRYIAEQRPDGATEEIAS
jgi:hypothetical protein